MIPKPWHRKGRGWYLELHGKQVKLGNTEADANKAYKKLIQENGLATPNPKHVTFHGLVGDYWTWYTATKAYETWNSRKHMKDSLLDFVPAAYLAESIDPPLVHKWIATNHKTAKSTSTQLKLIQFVNQILDWGVRYKYITVNNMKGIERPKPSIRQDFIPPRLFQAVISAAKSQNLRDYITFALDTGCRPQEMRAIEAQYFDGEKFVLPLDKSKGEKRRRVICLTPTSLGIAKRLCKQHATGPIFRPQRQRGGAVGWSNSAIGSAMRKIRDRINKWLPSTRQLNSLSPYVLRHSYAHYRISKGQEVARVSALMGHVSTKMVMERYGHMSEGDILSEAAKEIRLPGREPKRGANSSDS